MNNKIIALAIAAAFAAPMAAQAGPKVGGQLQAEINDYSLGTGSSVQRVDDNKRGRLWVTGSEDLGGGLKANYRYEWQVDTADGNAPASAVGSKSNTGSTTVGHTNAREARVGLSGSFGEVQFGRLKSPFKYISGVDYDPYTASQLESRGAGGALKDNGGMTKAYGQNSFLSNSMAYKSKFGSTKIWALYQFSESATEDDNIAIAASIGVSKSITVDVAYIEENKLSTTKGGSRSRVGIKWKMGAHKLLAKYETQSSDLANSDLDAIFIGYHFTMGKNVLTVQYGTVDSDANSATDEKNADLDYTMVAFKHKFSKKTSAWVGVRSTDYDLVNSKDLDIISFGMRINF